MLCIGGYAHETTRHPDGYAFLLVVWKSCRIVCIALSALVDHRELWIFSNLEFGLIQEFFLTKKINKKTRVEKNPNFWQFAVSDKSIDSHAMHTTRHDIQTTCMNFFNSNFLLVFLDQKTLELIWIQDLKKNSWHFISFEFFSCRLDVVWFRMHGCH